MGVIKTVHLILKCKRIQASGSTEAVPLLCVFKIIRELLFLFYLNLLGWLVFYDNLSFLALGGFDCNDTLINFFFSENAVLL